MSKARQLSAEQAAVRDSPVDRHAIVLAVAGSGKSTCLVERIAYLVEVKRVPPDRIIAAMFNQDAAISLTESLNERLGKALAPAAVTYHSLGTRVLALLVRQNMIEQYKFEASPAKAAHFAMRILEPTLNAHNIKNKRMVVDMFMGFIDRVKGDLSNPRDEFQRGDYPANLSWFVGAYTQYERARKAEKRRFFSDLIYDPIQIYLSSDSAAAVIRDNFDHIVVDEYQDICEAQQFLIDAVAGSRAKIMVVGDDDQTIYTWRGAKPSYILHDFAKRHPDPIIYKLTRTWRYGHIISLLANHVITKNVNRAEKLCISGGATKQSKAFVVHGENEFDDLNVIPPIRAWMAKGPDQKLSQIAILARTYGKTGIIQLMLLREGIHYRMNGPDHATVFNSLWIKAITGWMRIAAGEIAKFKYEGDPDAASVAAVMDIASPIWTGLDWTQSRQLSTALLKNPHAATSVNEFIRDAEGLHLAVRDRLRNFAMQWDFMRGLSSGNAGNSILVEGMNKVAYSSAHSLISYLYTKLEIEAKIKQVITNEENATIQIEQVKAYVAYAQRYDTNVGKYLDHINSLISFSQQAMDSVDALTICSVHRSKGLEWDCVILPALRDGWFPYQRGLRKGEPLGLSAEELEDERRLFYVAVTRTRLELHMLTIEDGMLKTAMANGQTTIPAELLCGESASRFLYEMNYNLSSLAGLLFHGVQAQLTLANYADKELVKQYRIELTNPN